MKKISTNEKRALAALTLNAECSNKEVAGFAEVREHVVRQARQKFLQNGTIQPVFLINVYQSGWTDFGVFLSLGGASSAVRTRLERMVKSDPQILWLGRLGGDFDYGLTFLARRNHEVDDFFSRVRMAANEHYLQKMVALKFDWTIYYPKYLAKKVGGPQQLSMSSRGPLLQPSKGDEDLLRALARNPSASLTNLARLSGTPPTSLSYRLEKLRESNYLIRQFYVMHPETLGLLTHRVLIGDMAFTSAQKEELRRFCTEHPNVVTFLSCTGAWDFEIRIENEVIEEVDLFRQELRDLFGPAIGFVKVVQQYKNLHRQSYPSL